MNTLKQRSLWFCNFSKTRDATSMIILQYKDLN